MKNSSALQALTSVPFRFFLATRLFLTLGLQMQAVIIGWRIYDLNHDPISLGLIGLAEAIPALSIALYAGHVADVRNKKSILLISVLVMFLSTLLLLLINLKHFETLFTNGGISIIIYLLIAISGFARGFYSPSAFSMIHKLVKREVLPHAGTLNSTAWQFAAVIGPALGGFLYIWFGITFTFILILLSIAIAWLSLFLMKGDFTPMPSTSEPIFVKLKEGIHFVFSNKIILSAISLDLFSVLFGGATALLPVFAKEILMTGPEGLGLLRAAPSLGAVLTMGYLSMSKSIQHPGKVLLFVVAGFGVCMIGFGMSQLLYLSLFFLFLSGAFDSISVIIRSNILQLQTPDHMRGRVSSVNTMFIGSSNEIGAFESGLAAKLFGTVASVVGGGCITLCVVLYTNLKATSLKKLQFDH